MTPSSLFSLTSTVSYTPNSYESTTSTLTQSKSPIVLDKVINVQLNNDIISNFIVINVVSIFIIFGLISILLCCVYGILFYNKKKNYCDECKKEINKKEIELNKKELNPANLKLAFVVDPKSENEVSSEDDVVICSENNNNTKLPNSVDS